MMKTHQVKAQYLIHLSINREEEFLIKKVIMILILFETTKIHEWQIIIILQSLEFFLCIKPKLDDARPLTNLPFCQPLKKKKP